MNEWHRQERNSNILKGIIALFIALLFIAALVFINYGSIWFDKKANAEIDHDVFKSNSSYIDGQVKDLSDYKKQYDRAVKNNDEEEANAVIQYIKDDFSNFPTNKIENENLKTFLNNVLNGKYD